jgi:uncharacterized linocin/CFP29 family protein
MADSNSPLQWTDDQWNRVRQVAYEEARGARVAGNFLPLYGPLDPDASYVAKELLCPPNKNPAEDVAGITVADTETLQLATLQTRVYLRAAQVADPELTSALIAFRRAANVLARLEDEIIFNGQKGANEGPDLGGQSRKSAPDALWEVRGGQKTDGLSDRPKPVNDAPPTLSELRRLGEALVSSISGAVGGLEASYHLGPFACVLDQVYFNAAQTPNDSSLVLPQDRILPFLGGGTLVRSSTLPPRSGVVIALGGAPIDLVVGTDISVQFLQVTEQPLFVFRVYEKIVLRVKDWRAIMPIQPDAKAK